MAWRYDASMRPPDLPGGNQDAWYGLWRQLCRASMRPPDLPGGNRPASPPSILGGASFNEAAGFTRRKRTPQGGRTGRRQKRFNEAAGFTRRKPVVRAGRDDAAPVASMRPPDLPGGNTILSKWEAHHGKYASMRPPDLPGGNRRRRRYSSPPSGASMRPPDLPGGNRCQGGSGSLGDGPGFNEAAGFTRRKRRSATG